MAPPLNSTQAQRHPIMPPKNAPANGVRRKGPAFNPPRPVNATSQPTTATKRASTAARRANGAAKKTNATASKSGFRPVDDIIDLSDDDDDVAAEKDADDFDSDDLDSIMEDVAPTHSAPPPANSPLAEPVVPRPLLARLLLENFDDPNMQIQTGAMKLVGKYIDIFVTEAFLRSKDERESAAKETGSVDSFLQVEDLEKLAPQLVLDF